MDFFLRGRTHLNRGEYQFQFLDDDALHLKEMGVVLVVELFGSAHVNEAVELFPAFEIVLHLVDELVQFSVLHTCLLFSVDWRLIRCFWEKGKSSPHREVLW